MFLKTLTMRGFKSFPDRTVLELEPGITVIVGPNGSGKSNIVDALSWVLGSHSPRRLRAGEMADVIFAGSAQRPALGRAVVDMTIDNSDGALPTEFSEVAVARGMFASGEHEYALNGVPCRLLDVQELLSDAGLGREHHGIVGQGQLEAVLSARPEDRRLFIEEAAGIAKHRKRRERALRKLAKVDDHLQRLHDVARELRRGLRPLERQAEAAATHDELQAALRRVRVTRALRALDELERRDQGEAASRGESDRRLADQRSRLEGLRHRESRLQAELDALTERAHEAGETRFRLAGVVERFRGLGQRIEERRRGLAQALAQDSA
ncbi:MAG: AAA family ATPase, partial [Actinomycetota bacterium]|nr:AAA family ATPase [Actinomycetota bacterium]